MNITSNPYWFLVPVVTKTRHYLYNAIVNKLYETSKDVFDAAGGIISAAGKPNNTLEEHVKRYGAAGGSAIHFRRFSLEEIKQRLDKNMSDAVLIMTEDCNMRCKYCIHSGNYKNYRTHSGKKMEIATAYACVDLLKGAETEEVHLSFYGGESLLEFEKIRKVVSYAEKAIKKRIILSISTNGTLLDAAKVSYMKKKGFFIHISMDGPQNIQDKYRVDDKGKGVFFSVIKALESIKKAFPDYYKTNVSFNVTVVDWNDISNIRDFFRGDLFRDQHFQVNALNSSANNLKYQKEPSEKLKISMAEMENSPFLSSYFNKMIYRIDNVLGRKPDEELMPNGICIPGERKVVCQVNGNLTFCEKIPETNVIGNVFSGMNHGLIKNIIDEYTSGCEQICRECWCLNFCDLCFAHTIDKGSFNTERKMQNCSRQRKMILESLKLYCIMKEEKRVFLVN